MKNQLNKETSPYLLQHKDNPVFWQAWKQEAFLIAKKENKPIFLSIGYSTCHWCHIMAHECFEDEQVAKILNDNFVSIKVDREERPDIDSIYMSVCQKFTGSGGWPTTIFMTPDQKPFFAGTYFPKESFIDLLKIIIDKWKNSEKEIINSANLITKSLKENEYFSGELEENLLLHSKTLLEKSYDERFGGFGKAPKFPVCHNLLFLMEYSFLYKDTQSLEMVENTLIKMYKGGIFDHIGYGFSRYSTDDYFLVPHFEKMLYDNALLIMSYSKAYQMTKKPIYKEIAEKTAEYIINEMIDVKGGFYTAQDSASEGIEGKFYLLDYDEIIDILGNDLGRDFNRYYNITKTGNFNGKNIPNLINNDKLVDKFTKYLPEIRKYRKERTNLMLDDKILTANNGLMISAFSYMYKSFNDEKYLDIAEKACEFVLNNLCSDNLLYASICKGQKSDEGFLDDYAYFIFALINLYDCTLNKKYLEKAILLCRNVIDSYYDKDFNGFFMNNNKNENLIARPKQTYDGAIPSGNSIMSYNLVRISNLIYDKKIENITKRQLEFMSGISKNYPAGYTFFMIALSCYIFPYESVVCVIKDKTDIDKIKAQKFVRANVKIIENPTNEYKLLNDKLTFYVCKNKTCYPPTNEIGDYSKSKILENKI